MNAQEQMSWSYVLDAAHWGEIECVPMRTPLGVRYTYPGGRLYSKTEIQEIAREQGWKLWPRPYLPKASTSFPVQRCKEEAA